MNARNVQPDFEIENDTQHCCVKIKNLNNKKGVFRIVASLPSAEILSPQNCKVYAIDKQSLQMIEVPASVHIKNPKFWDIGIVSGNFFILNV